MAPDGDAELDPKLTRSFVVPTCVHCTGIVRPDIVFFGENVPIHRVEQAFALLNFGEYLLVTGSSLTVYSGFRFVRRAAQSGKPVAIINIGPTRGDDLAAIRIEASTGESLSRLYAVLMSR
jgi:NAD-dependent SIR2 family protein deacetylase